MRYVTHDLSVLLFCCSASIAQCSYWWPVHRQGFALALYAGIGNLAPGVFTFIIPKVVQAWSLAGAYLCWWLFLCIGCVLYYFVGCNPPSFQLINQGVPRPIAYRVAHDRYGQEIFPKTSFTESAKLACKNYHTWILSLLYFTTFGGFLAATTW